MPIQTSDNKFSTAKFIVNPTAGLGTHTTITAALAAAASGDYVLVTQGTYTENPTLPAGVTLSGMPGAGDAPSTTVVGTITMTAAGSSAISNLNLRTNSAACIVVSGSNACVLTIDFCNFDITNNTAITYSNSNASSNVNIYNCSGDITTTGIALYTMSSAGLLYIEGSVFTNTGNSVTASTSSAGTTQWLWSEVSSPVSVSNAARFDGLHSYFFLDSLNAVICTFNSTTQSTLQFCNLNNLSAAQSTISIGAAALAAVLNSIVSTGNADWVTGTGTLGYGGVIVNPNATINAGVTANAVWNFVGTVKP